MKVIRWGRIRDSRPKLRGENLVETTRDHRKSRGGFYEEEVVGDYPDIVRRLFGHVRTAPDTGGDWGDHENVF